MVNNILVVVVLSLASMAAAARSLKKGKKSKKSQYPKYTETLGYHKTGNYMIFKSYADNLCSEDQFKESHGYALGVVFGG